MIKTALVLIAAILATPQDKAASRPPKPAPQLYVSQKFGLMIKVPSGLSYCPLPKKWSGEDEGTVLFLAPPTGCLESGATSSSTRLISGFAPSVTIYYRANAGRFDNFDGNIPRLRSSDELGHQFCPQPLPSELRLLGQPSFTCRVDLAGSRVRVILVALYDSGNRILVTTLLTTHERLAGDQRIFESIAFAIAACEAAATNKKTEPPACPNGSAW